MATIRKRSWRTASGERRERWQVDFRDQNGARVHKQFDRKKDADAFLVRRAVRSSAGPSRPIAPASRSPKLPTYGWRGASATTSSSPPWSATART